MKYTFKENITIQEFNDFTYNHKLGTFFQSEGWSMVKKGWIPFFTGVYKEGQLVGCSLVLKRKLFLNYAYMYSPRGLVVDSDDHDLVSFYLQSLDKFSKEQKAISLLIDPYILRAHYDMNEAMKHDLDVKYDDSVLELFKKEGYRHHGFKKDLKETLQPRFQPVLYLDEDHYKKSRAYKAATKALNNHVSIKRGREDVIEEFDHVIKKTADFKNISLRELSYFYNIISIFKEDALITLATLDLNEEFQSLTDRKDDLNKRLENPTLKEGRRKEYESQVAKLKKDIEFTQEELQKGHSIVTLAGLLVIKNGTKAELLYAGMDRDYLRYAGSNVNYYDALEWAKENNCEKLYFGGSSGNFDEGIDKFKASFNPWVEEFIGEFEMVNKPLFKKVFDSLLKLRKSLLNRKK